MTNKVTMPDPVVVKYATKLGKYTMFQSDDPRVRKKESLYTDDQMEAYADARVREALLEAYRSMQELHMSLMNDATPYVPPAQIASFAANRISALIPKYTHSMLS